MAGVRGGVPAFWLTAHRGVGFVSHFPCSQLIELTTECELALRKAGGSRAPQSGEHPRIGMFTISYLHPNRPPVPKACERRWVARLSSARRA